MEIILYTQYFSIKFVYVFERNIFHFDANALNLISIRKKKKKLDIACFLSLFFLLLLHFLDNIMLHGN